MLEDSTMEKLKHILAVGEREGVFQTKGRASGVQAEAQVRSSAGRIQYLSGIRACSPD